ncbi:hypothetical protein CP977_19820 [Streptomyces cinereoruber]|uniref:Uncharacterized protein n=1 Tax=Streptomyces cinereoruber TaxID=67260 RepID=A0ABX6BJB9_9ACTN|nr:hypothetical protein CP977_19820 [Streptomyces cinereoruber]
MGVGVGVGVGVGLGDAVAVGRSAFVSSSGGSWRRRDNRNHRPESTVATIFCDFFQRLVQARAMPAGGKITSRVMIRAGCCHQRRRGGGAGAYGCECGGGYTCVSPGECAPVVHEVTRSYTRCSRTGTLRTEIETLRGAGRSAGLVPDGKTARDCRERAVRAVGRGGRVGA